MEECDGSLLERNRFGWEDYLVFSAVLVISMGIGVFFGCFKKQNTAADFLLGGRQMNFWSLGASLTLGFTSAISVLGNTAEMYNYGTQYAMVLIAFAIMVPVTTFLYLPTFRSLGITSIYEYFNKRYSNRTRLLMSILFVIQTLLYLSVVVYAPALALRAVTGLDVITASALIFAVSVVYSSLGGIKAVVWTDTFQFIVIIVALIAVLILGGLVDGDPAVIWQDAQNSSRIEFFNMDPDPRIRHSFWTVIVGGTFYWIAMNSATQSSVQRLMTAPSNKHAAWAMWLSALGMTVIFSITFYLGLVAFTHYKDCDPLLNKEIEATDQLLPFYVMEVASSLPGLSGLFVAGVFSASLSTVASSLNALAASTLKDILVGGFNYKPSESRVFLVMQLGGVLQVAISLNGMLAGAALGTFTLGMYVPWSNEWGAILGTIFGFATSLWLCIGAQVVSLSGKLVVERKSVGINCGDDCFVNQPDIPDPNLVFDGYRVSYLYYTPIAYIVTMIVGVIVSGLTGWEKIENVDPALLSTLIRNRVKRHVKVIELETKETNS
ncbi:Hypothetical predicted protein [Cloeon dipterum]|uniref:Sodium-coupled monocarboxylate transporter 1 n=1 Tax=Cloeon dipterum TaxID=197152 RepID=A0A8S1C1M7_9INSE|nr:Hypothetical predicted protein [Cloeon dipterum]